MSDDTTSIVDDAAVAGKTRRILVVDDEIDITAIYSMLFELHGFEVLTAANGRQALGLIGTEPPDIVLSDCMMPVMDGIELTRILRSDPKTAEIPIILTSALPDPERLGSSKHDLFIQKPANFSALLKSVKRMLSKT
ncbi:response regulator [Noviherbaspirillum pedocola]|uniref:Response regulator n=1 Tax=Noviherbaspirillum pedocola TaxID=2801341 RepID=A0A934W8A3_9BURK|nr:response regulator [Noviherbaspirillum pedocola]MBK4738387.1 response regulator [Noviherbaspirillum pedocola]